MPPPDAARRISRPASRHAGRDGTRSVPDFAARSLDVEVREHRTRPRACAELEAEQAKYCYDRHDGANLPHRDSFPPARKEPHWSYLHQVPSASCHVRGGAAAADYPLSGSLFTPPKWGIYGSQTSRSTRAKRLIR